MTAVFSLRDDPAPVPIPAILVVDDDVLARMVTAAYLRDCGYDVIEAGNADEAIRIMEVETGIDMIFSDINMPGSLDGLGLSQWIQGHLRTFG